MPASIGVNLRVTGHCDQGGRKYMEDLFSVAYQQTEDEKDLEYAFFGIFDGHGGSEAAAFAKEHLMDSVVKQRQFWSDSDEDVLRAIRNGYMLTHLNMWKELDKWPKTVSGLPSTAGTTASVAFIRRGKIYIGHVGDSAIVLGYQEEGKDEWKAKPLTLDHKPESIPEMERIHQSGGKVVAKAGVPRVVWNRPRLGHKGPIKKTTPIDEIPFLAVARSLGDLWSYNFQNDEFVVSPDPDVGVLIIDPSKFRCLIFGTDGLWNMISPDMAVRLVQEAERHNDAATVAEAMNSGQPGKPRRWLNPSKSLVDSALERWSNTRMRADNTSVVTLMLDPPGPPRAEVLRSRGTRAFGTPAAVPTAAVPSSRSDPSSPIDAENRVMGRHTKEVQGVTTVEENPTGNCTVSAVKSEVERTDTSGDAPASGQMPLSGLAILTRYPEEEGVAPASDAIPELPSESVLESNVSTVPLPPCASLDGRFSGAKCSMVSMHCISVDSPQDVKVEEIEVEEGESMNNYGNPSESYFIARLLNKSQVKNSLQHVFEEIVYGIKTNEITAEPEEPTSEEINLLETSTFETPCTFVNKAPSLLVKHATASSVQHSLDRVTIKQRLSVCSSSIIREKTPEVSRSVIETKDVSRESVVPDVSDTNQKSIQINEVSSSSPIDTPPKLKGRKPKVQERISFQAQQPHGRSLRSHDALNLMQRPQTRSNGSRSKPLQYNSPRGKSAETRIPAAAQTNKMSSSNQDRIIILNRSKGILITPNMLQSKQPPKPDTAQGSKIHPKINKQCPSIDTKISKAAISIDKVDMKQRPSAPRSLESDGSGGQNGVRITRSRDASNSPTDVLLKSAKDTAHRGYKKSNIEEVASFPLGKPKIESQRHQITTRNRTSFTDKIPIELPTRHSNHTFHTIQKSTTKSLNSHLECSKENFIAECPDNITSGLISAMTTPRDKICKRRNSDHSMIELEPKEKRRTRLDDKKLRNDRTLNNQNHDISSSDSLRNNFYLGLHMTAAGIRALPIVSRRKMKSCIIDNSKSTNDINILGECSTGEVDSTTADNVDSCEYDAALSIPSRALRSRNDLNNHTSGKAHPLRPVARSGVMKEKTHSSFHDSTKRSLRSKDGLKISSEIDGKINCLHKVQMAQVLRAKSLQPNVEIERMDRLKTDELLRQTRSSTSSSATPVKRSVLNGTMSKRLSGRTPWPPAVATRNRLRKRFSN